MLLCVIGVVIVDTMYSEIHEADIRVDTPIRVARYYDAH